MPRSIFFSPSYIVPLLEKTQVTYWSGQTPQASIQTPIPSFGRFNSVVTEVGARRILSLQREPRLTLFFLYQRTKTHNPYDMIFFRIAQKRLLRNAGYFTSLYPSCPLYGEHRTRSPRTHHLKWLCYSQEKRSISNLQGQDLWTLWIKQAWRNLTYCLFFFVCPFWYRFKFFSIFVYQSCHIYFL